MKVGEVRLNEKLIETGEFIHKSLLNGSSKTNPAFDEAMLLFVCNSLTILKEQEAVTIKRTKENVFGVYGGTCPKCHNWIQSAHSFCGFCGQAVKWE